MLVMIWNRHADERWESRGTDQKRRVQRPRFAQDPRL